MDVTPRQLRSDYANAEAGIRHIFVRDLALIAMVGIYEHEKKHPQRILVNIDCAVQELGGPLEDDIRNVVSYEKVVKNVKSIVHDGHVNLVETLAEKIAEKVLQAQGDPPGPGAGGEARHHSRGLQCRHRDRACEAGK
jgi:FolB domain-containing protein